MADIHTGVKSYADLPGILQGHGGCASIEMAQLRHLADAGALGPV